jgi:hypothetical protein
MAREQGMNPKNFGLQIRALSRELVKVAGLDQVPPREALSLALPSSTTTRKRTSASLP